MWLAETEAMVSPLCRCVAARKIVRRQSWVLSEDILVTGEDFKKNKQTNSSNYVIQRNRTSDCLFWFKDLPLQEMQTATNENILNTLDAKNFSILKSITHNYICFEIPHSPVSERYLFIVFFIKNYPSD